MGLSWSGSNSNSNRRRPQHTFLQNPPHPLFITPYPPPFTPLPPPPPPPPFYAGPYPPHQGHLHHCCCHHSNGYPTPCGFNGPVSVSQQFGVQASQSSNGWPAAAARPSVAAPRHEVVEHSQGAKKIRNDVNVHKDSIRIDGDENNPGCHLVSFTFDALVDGSITIFYFAKEGANCTFTPLYPEVHVPVRVPFLKGLCQKFHQPSGTGIDLGFFDIDDLSNPTPGEGVFPLVIFAEAFSAPITSGVLFGQPQSASSHAQITQAVLEKNNDGSFHIKAVNQILWVDGVRYELRDIYEIGYSSGARVDGNEPGKDCVICMSEPKDTAVLPCRHLCMCGDCAKALRLQTNKCPICRQPIEELIEIRVNASDF
ncbi:hypothetical protein Syun_029095 [Stephania yunnanensis]|uniref:RING-type E3 ubiquitin transferase n=1 Tax=Stephania yunnanensis TaxID=152371 RepID=A0AAP0HJH9_9MAGN